MDAPGSPYSFRSVHGESGEQFFAAPAEYLAQGGIADAGKVSGGRELDGGRNPLASPLKSGVQSKRTGTGGCGEPVASDPPGHPARHSEYSGGLGLPGHLAVSTSVGRWRQMPEMSLYVMPGDNRWTDNLLVSGVPEAAGVQELQQLRSSGGGISASASRGRIPFAFGLRKRFVSSAAGGIGSKDGDGKRDHSRHTFAGRFCQPDMRLGRSLALPNRGLLLEY